MDTHKRKYWNLRGNNYGIIWLEENLLGSILKCHVCIDRKMADFMSVSTEKTVYKSTFKSANVQWRSDHLELQIYLRKVTLLGKVTWISKRSSEKWLRNSILFLESNFKRHSFPSLYQFVHHCEKIRKFGLSVLLEDLNIKLDLHELSSSLYPGYTKIWWTRFTKIKHYL